MTTYWIEPAPVSELPKILRRFTGPWWVAGGHAIDLYLGRTTRAHVDLDVALRRVDQFELQTALSGWDLWVADDGTLVPWPAGEPLGDAHHEVWARRSPTDAWCLEILFEATVGDRWVYRRDDRVSMPIDDIGIVRAQLPALHPAIQLLYKSSNPRDKDTLDLLATLPELPAEDVRWLRRSLELVESASPWLRHLRT